MARRWNLVFKQPSADFAACEVQGARPLCCERLNCLGPTWRGPQHPVSRGATESLSGVRLRTLMPTIDPPADNRESKHRLPVPTSHLVWDCNHGVVCLRVCLCVKKQSQKDKNSLNKSTLVSACPRARGSKLNSVTVV